MFNPRHVLRHLPTKLVRRFCEFLNIKLAVVWTSEPSANTLFEEYKLLSPELSSQFEQMLIQVHELGTQDGIKQLYEEAIYRSAALEDVDVTYGPQAVALLHMLDRNDVFQHVHLLNAADKLTKRYWHTVTALPARRPDFSPPVLDRIGVAIGRYLKEEQGRGGRVTVEYLVRAGREHYVFCYPDDYTSTHVAHDSSGLLARTPVRPTFEVIFAYDERTGTLEVYAPLRKQDRVQLQLRFCNVVLDADPADWPTNKPVYQLDRLLDRSRPLVPDPLDRVTEVRVTRLLVALPNSGRRVELRGDPARPPDDTFRLLDDLLPEDLLPRSWLHVIAATFLLTYQRPQDPKPRTLTFDVSYPDTCTLQTKQEEPRRLGEKCLRLWGITRG